MTDVYQQIIAALEASKNVLVTTHIRPDGDALGSAAAMILALRRKGIPHDLLLLSHWPTKYAFLRDQFAIPHHDAEKVWPATLDLKAFDTLLVIDTGTWSQLPGLQEKLNGFTGRKLILDHHRTQENWADLKLVSTEAGAAGEIVAELLDQWQIPLDTEIATALFVAITTDTGWFQFSNTRPYTLRLAARLLEAGVDMDGIYKRLYQAERRERVHLQTRAMQSLELLANGKLAVMTLRKSDFHDTQANVPDTENLINVPMQIGSVEVSMLITEPIDFGPTRVSLRSKGAVDVSKFAEGFGGGGHARASGLKLEQDVASTRATVVEAMLTELAKQTG
jgi:phosphoesterase RecJ-like protein